MIFTARQLQNLHKTNGHVRLPVGDWLGRQMLALGMLYYRLRDVL